MEVKFIFRMDETVITPFGEDCIVSMLGYDDGGQQYYIKTKDGANWFKEDQLRKNGLMVIIWKWIANNNNQITEKENYHT